MPSKKTRKIAKEKFPGNLRNDRMLKGKLKKKTSSPKKLMSPFYGYFYYETRKKLLYSSNPKGPETFPLCFSLLIETDKAPLPSPSLF